MITELTKEQEKRIPEYYGKWRNIGYSTDRIDRAKAEQALKTYLKGVSSCKEIVFCDSPKACQDYINERAGNKTPQYYPIYYWTQSGNMSAGYCAFYDYIIEELKKPDDDTLKLWEVYRTYCETLHYIWTFEDLVVCSERPVTILTKNNQLHADGQAAVRYADGWSLYYLNGVAVPEWLAVTPRDNLDALAFAKIENVEVRREFVRKMGVERMMEKLGTKLIDKWGDYELHLIDLGGATGNWPYLKMLNPSIGVWHVEAVGKECKTVKEALAWRDNEDEYVKPEVLT